MAEGYKIREHKLGAAHMRLLVLAKETSEKDFVDKLFEDKRDPKRIQLIVRVMERIQFEGVGRSERTRLIKVLDTNV